MSNKIIGLQDRQRNLEEKIAQLRKQLIRVNDELDQLIEMPNRQTLVGKCFKYRNSYSCPQKESDYWWLYLRVERLEGKNLCCIHLQRDSRGITRIEWPHYEYEKLIDGYIEITAKEFEKACGRLIAGMPPISKGG